MAKRRPLPTEEALLIRYGRLLALPTTRDRVIKSLRSIVSEHRRRGVPDEQNTVLAFLRKFSPLQPMGQYPRVAAAGLLDLPVVGTMRASTWRRILERFLAHSRLGDLASANRDHFVNFLERRERRIGTRYANERPVLEAVFDAAFAVGLRDDNPVPPRAVRISLRVSALSPEQQREAAAIRDYHEKFNLTRATENNRYYWYKRGLLWLRTTGRDAGLDAPTWEPGGAEAFAMWLFLRPPNEPAAPKGSWAGFRSFLRFLWRLNHDPVEVDQRARRLTSELQSSRRTDGYPDRFRWRRRDPAPPPSVGAVERALAELGAEISAARSARP